jgi:thiol:disulfide interchange protein DsbD
MLLILLGGGAASAQPGGKSVVVTERTRAELLVHAPEGVEPGKPVWVGLQLAHQPDWHSYWKNSGDSGLPTKLEWKLPAGVLAGEIAWPMPRKYPIGTLINYGYEHTVMLPVPLTITPEFRRKANSRSRFLSGARRRCTALSFWRASRRSPSRWRARRQLLSMGRPCAFG